MESCHLTRGWCKSCSADHRGHGSTTGNHVEYRVVPYQAVSAWPHLMTLPASQACGYWELTSTYGTTKTDAAGAHVSSPASWTTRGKDHPTARLLDLVPGRSGTVYKNWLEERGEDFRAGCESRHWIPFQGYKNPIA